MAAWQPQVSSTSSQANHPQWPILHLKSQQTGGDSRVSRRVAAVDRKADALAEQIKKNKHLIIFTGACISTVHLQVVSPMACKCNQTMVDNYLQELLTSVASMAIGLLQAKGKPRTKHVNTQRAIPTLSSSCKTVVFSRFLSVRIVMAFIGEVASCLRVVPLPIPSRRPLALTL